MIDIGKKEPLLFDFYGRASVLITEPHIEYEMTNFHLIIGTALKQSQGFVFKLRMGILTKKLLDMTKTLKLTL